MSTGSAEKDAEVIDEFEEIARETLDRIISIIENDSSIVDLNDSNSELITEAEISTLIKEDIELRNPVDLNKKEFEKSPITNNTCTIRLRSNKNIVHSEYIPVKIKKMASPKTTYPFISACETIIDAVESDQLPLLLKMIAATKLNGKAYNATRYKEINAWSDLKQIIIDAFEPPYGAANLQIELNIIKMKPNESVHSYNNRVEEIFQKLCNAVTVGKTSSQTMTLRDNIGEQALVSYINVDKNFPIRKHGIIDNRNIILKPRTESIVPIPIAAKDVENKDIFIH
ncbi:protein DDB G0276689-like, partial [Aphis craccivora]